MIWGRINQTKFHMFLFSVFFPLPLPLPLRSCIWLCSRKRCMHIIKFTLIRTCTLAIQFTYREFIIKFVFLRKTKSAMTYVTNIPEPVCKWYTLQLLYVQNEQNLKHKTFIGISFGPKRRELSVTVLFFMRFNFCQYDICKYNHLTRRESPNDTYSTIKIV